MYKEKFRRKAGLSLLDPNLQLPTEDPDASQQTADGGGSRRPLGGAEHDEDGQEYVLLSC